MRNHPVILSDVHKVNNQLRRAQARVDELLAARVALYVEARDRPDPIPYSRIAAAAGVTESAVTQVVRRAMPA